MFTTQLTNMTMENQPFQDVSPIKDGDFPLPCCFFWGVSFSEVEFDVDRNVDILFIKACFVATPKNTINLDTASLPSQL